MGAAGHRGGNPVRPGVGSAVMLQELDPVAATLGK
jgi:hypothetical protein